MPLPNGLDLGRPLSHEECSKRLDTLAWNELKRLCKEAGVELSDLDWNRLPKLKSSIRFAYQTGPTEWRFPRWSRMYRGDG